MTQAKHTPGPWKFYTEPQPNGCPIVGSRGLMVVMLAHSIHEQDQCETAIANATLIAAAPELLDQLKKLRRAYVSLLESGRDRIINLGGTCDPVDVMEANDPNLRDVAQIISKATGSAA